MAATGPLKAQTQLPTSQHLSYKKSDEQIEIMLRRISNKIVIRFFSRIGLHNSSFRKIRCIIICSYDFVRFQTVGTYNSDQNNEERDNVCDNGVVNRQFSHLST